MAASPWIPFPTSFPAFGTPVWVRLRDFTRRPFQAVWQEFDGAGVTAANGYAQVTDATNVTSVYVPWYELDAWHPV